MKMPNYLTTAAYLTVMESDLLILEMAFNECQVEDEAE
jgi:hypothetical protein